MIFDFACYNIHHARFIMNAEPEQVHTIGWRGKESGVDESMTVNMAFPEGRSAQFWVSYVDSSTQSIEVFGSGGSLRMDKPWNNEDQVTTLAIQDRTGKREDLEFAPVFQFALQLQHMCDCLNTGQPHRIPVANSVAQMRVIDAIYKSLDCGSAVDISA